MTPQPTNLAATKRPQKVAVRRRLPSAALQGWWATLTVTHPQTREADRGPDALTVQGHEMESGEADMLVKE